MQFAAQQHIGCRHIRPNKYADEQRESAPQMGFGRGLRPSETLMLATEQLAAFALPAPEAGGSWSVYLIWCDNQSLYCGITNRPEARFAAHLAGKGARYTRIRKPLSMRLVYENLSRPHALSAEIRIKQLTAAQKRQLWQLLHDFQTA